MLEVSYSKTKNEYLQQRTSTKTIVNIQGRLYIDCTVQSVVYGSLFTTQEIGEASGNMQDFELHYNRAINNAIYKHIARGGVSGARVIHIKNYWIKYFNDNVEVKRKYVKPPQKVVEVPSSTRIVKRTVKETKEVKVKGYIRNGVKVKPHTRTFTIEKEVFEEQLVRGYTYKKTIGKGYYKSSVSFKGEEILIQGYKRRSVSSLNKDLLDININMNKASMIDKI